MKRKPFAPQAGPRQTEVIHLSDYHRESTPFDKPRGKARILLFKRPEIQIGDYVTARNSTANKSFVVTSIKPIFGGSVRLLGLDGNPPSTPEFEFKFVWRTPERKERVR